MLSPPKIAHREHRVLRISFWIKLLFVLIELVLAIAFAACTFTKHRDAGAVIEWAIAFIFSFYVFSFCADLYPAIYTKQRGARFPKRKSRNLRQMEEATRTDGRHDSDRQLNGGAAMNGYSTRPTNF